MFPFLSHKNKNTQIYTAAIIGCGRIGYSLGLDKKREQPASHTMAMNENSRIKLIAACDSDFSKAEEWHRANNPLPAYMNTANLFARHKPDIITVAVNEDNHLKVALESIEDKPKLLILEKPVALNTEEALEIKAASERYGVPILVNHERRFANDYAIARDYLDKIGDIQSIEATLSSGMRVYDSKEEKTGNYSLIHDGTHLVDIVSFFLEHFIHDPEIQNKEESDGIGLLQRANALKRKPILHNPVITGLYRDDTDAVRNVSVHYKTSVCPEVCINFSGRSKYFGFDIDIRGTDGRICIGNGYLRCYKNAVSPLYSGFKSLTLDNSVTLPEKTGYFSNMIQNAVDFLDGKAELKSTLRTGMDALIVLEEIKKLLV